MQAVSEPPVSSSGSSNEAVSRAGSSNFGSEVPLRVYDLNLFNMVSHYDPRSKEDRRRATREFERLFVRLLGVFKPDLFIEAGAKNAWTSRNARRKLADARIVAFEANPFTFERYRHYDNAAAGVEYLHIAIADAPGTTTINVLKSPEGKPRADGQSSLLKRDDYAHGYEEVTVDTTSIDAFFSDHNFKRCAVWMDLEGAAGPALLGARETLKKAAMVMIEVEDRPVWEGQWLRPQVTRFLFDLGLVPIARDIQSANQYNLIFVREPLLDVAMFRRVFLDHHVACRQPKANPKKAAGIMRDFLRDHLPPKVHKALSRLVTR